MNWIPWLAVLGAAACVALGVLVERTIRGPKPAHVPPAHEPQRHLFTPAGTESDATQTMTSTTTARRLLATAPTIDGVTLRDYLTHHATRTCPHPSPDNPRRPAHAGTWPCVVEDVYAGALGSSLVAPYFDDVDAQGLAELRGHFLSALVAVTHTGLTVAVARRLEEKHAHLGITAPVFEAVTGVLVRSIGAYTTTDVMNHVLPQMAPLVRELRARLVTA